MSDTHQGTTVIDEEILDHYPPCEFLRGDSPCSAPAVWRSILPCPGCGPTSRLTCGECRRIWHLYAMAVTMWQCTKCGQLFQKDPIIWLPL